MTVRSLLGCALLAVSAAAGAAGCPLPPEGLVPASRAFPGTLIPLGEPVRLRYAGSEGGTVRDLVRWTTGSGSDRETRVSETRVRVDSRPLGGELAWELSVEAVTPGEPPSTPPLPAVRLRATTTPEGLLRRVEIPEPAAGDGDGAEARRRTARALARWLPVLAERPVQTGETLYELASTDRSERTLGVAAQETYHVRGTVLGATEMDERPAVVVRHRGRVRVLAHRGYLVLEVDGFAVIDRATGFPLSARLGATGELCLGGRTTALAGELERRGRLADSAATPDPGTLN